MAHSNYDGFMFDRNINAENIFGLAGPSLHAQGKPADNEQQESGDAASTT